MSRYLPALIALSLTACWTTAVTTPQAPTSPAAADTNAVVPPMSNEADAITPATTTRTDAALVGDVAPAPSPAPAPAPAGGAPDPSFTPPAADATPTPPTDAPPAAATTAPVEKKLGWYIGGAGLYLPIDDGLTALSATGGVRLVFGPLEARFGARLAYGEGQYSSAVAVIVEAQVIRWFGVFGLGAVAGAGPIIASPKMSGGWDGLLPGALVMGTARLRFDKLEPSFDLGVLDAVGNDYPAPFAMLGLTGRM